MYNKKNNTVSAYLYTFKDRADDIKHTQCVLEHTLQEARLCRRNDKIYGDVGPIIKVEIPVK
jgi:hypothetical protein